MDILNDKNEYNTFRPLQKALQLKRNASYEKNKNEIHTRSVEQANRSIQEKRSEQKNNYEKHAYKRYTD